MPSRGLVRDSADGHKFVGILPNAEFFAVLDQILPVRIVMRGMEAVTVVLVLQIGDGAVWKNRLTVDSLGAGQIQRDGVGGCEHADVRDNGDVVFRVAVAVRRDVADNVDAVAGAPSRTALAYSAILQLRSLTLAWKVGWMASLGQTAMQRPQPTQLF